MGWVVLVERLAEEAYAPLYTSFSARPCCFCSGSAWLGWRMLLMGRRVVRPVEMLAPGRGADRRRGAAVPARRPHRG